VSAELLGIGGRRYLLLELASGEMGFVPEDAWIPARQVTGAAETPAAPRKKRVATAKPVRKVKTPKVAKRSGAKPAAATAAPAPAGPVVRGTPDRDTVIAEFRSKALPDLTAARRKYPDVAYPTLWNWWDAFRKAAS
jgi:hypothetical protein